MYWSFMFPSLRAAKVSENVRTTTLCQALHHWCGQEVRGGPEGNHLSLLPKLLAKANSHTIFLVHMRMFLCIVLVSGYFIWLLSLSNFTSFQMAIWPLQIIILVDIGHHLVTTTPFSEYKAAANRASETWWVSPVSRKSLLPQHWSRKTSSSLDHLWWHLNQTG